MNIFLIGYMASGKSTIGKLLASKLDYEFLDFDDYIEKNEAMDIPTIFSTKGEIYFRKKEAQYLKEVLNSQERVIVALGGGTPCYGNNMELIKSAPHVKSVYLRLAIAELAERLSKEKEHRPMVSHLTSKEELLEFVGKHLFERQFFYNQSNFVLDTNGCSVEETVEKIILQLF